MDSHVAEELQEELTVESVNAEHYSSDVPEDAGKGKKLSPLSLPAWATTQDEKESAVGDEHEDSPDA